MSYETWHTYGYGICTDNIKTTPERIEQLLLLAPEYAAKIHATLTEWEDGEWKFVNATEEDYLMAVEEFDSGYYGLASLLRSVIYEAEGINLTACDNFDCCTFLVYEPCYPWQIREKNRDLTEEKLWELFDKYVSILTDEMLDVDYQSIGNGG